MSPSELVAIARVADSAAKTRAAQRQYFATRDKRDLVVAKQAESALDHDLATLDAVRRAENQARLPL